MNFFVDFLNVPLPRFEPRMFRFLGSDVTSRPQRLDDVDVTVNATAGISNAFPGVSPVERRGDGGRGKGDRFMKLSNSDPV